MLPAVYLASTVSVHSISSFDLRLLVVVLHSQYIQYNTANMLMQLLMLAKSMQCVALCGAYEMKALIIIYFEMRMNFNCYVCTVFENEKKEKKHNYGIRGTT